MSGEELVVLMTALTAAAEELNKLSSLDYSPVIQRLEKILPKQEIPTKDGRPQVTFHPIVDMLLGMFTPALMEALTNGKGRTDGDDEGSDSRGQ